MRITAQAKYIRYSPFKLRLLADVVRGKTAVFALNYLTTAAYQRAIPLKKVIASAVANAKSLHNYGIEQLKITKITVDQGPSHKYFKPGAMGRSNVYKKRLSHINVVLEPLDIKEA